MGVEVGAGDGGGMRSECGERAALGNGDGGAQFPSLRRGCGVGEEVGWSGRGIGFACSPERDGRVLAGGEDVRGFGGVAD